MINYYGCIHVGRTIFPPKKYIIYTLCLLSWILYWIFFSTIKNSDARPQSLKIDSRDCVICLWPIYTFFKSITKPVNIRECYGIQFSILNAILIWSYLEWYYLCKLSQRATKMRPLTASERRSRNQRARNRQGQRGFQRQPGGWKIWVFQCNRWHVWVDS